MEVKKKNKFNFYSFLIAIAFIAIAFLAGYAIGALLFGMISDEAPPYTIFAVGVIALASMALGFIVHIIVHEAGHLIFGLMTGYTFCSFRIFSLMWIKKDGKICLRRMSLSGTAGQCLLVPPEMKDGKFPTKLYNFGGAIANTVLSLLLIPMFFIGNLYVSAVTLMVVLTGLLLAASNGIPLNMGTITNDGYNAISLSKNEKAMRALWLQLKINALVSQGYRLSEMPDEYFERPADEDMNNTLVAAIAVFRCNRLVEQKLFDDALKEINHLLELESGIIGIYKNLLICDKISLLLLKGEGRDVVGGLYTKELYDFMRSMKTFPTVIRTEYITALLMDGDTDKAQNALERFEDCAKKYPYPSDIDSERELIIAANDILRNAVNIEE